MKYTIGNIFTSIRNRKVWVDIWTNDDPEDYLNEPILSVPFDAIAKVVIDILPMELELLTGCVLKDEFEVGDHQFDRHHRTIPPTLIWPGNMEKLKAKSSQYLLPFQQIHNIIISSKNNTKPYVRILTTDNSVYFMNLNYFMGVVGLTVNQFNLLKGVFISPIKYLTGEKMLNSFNVYQGESGKIVKSFNFRFEGTLDEHQAVHGNTILMPKPAKYSGGYYNQNNSSSYEKYGGYNDWDDQTIDDAFEGDPYATWNVD